jgi:hypothetical protein
MARSRTRETDEAIQRLADQAGALVTFETNSRGGHRRVYLKYNGQSRFNVLSGTPGRDGFNAAVGQAKKTLRSMGAQL